MNRFFPLLSDADKAEAEKLFLEVSGEGNPDEEDGFGEDSVEGGSNE